MCRVDSESVCRKCGGLAYWAGNDITGEGAGWQCTKCQFFESSKNEQATEPDVLTHAG